MNDVRDAWFWLLDEKGDYTVKSGYRWLQGEFEDADRRYWNKVWSLKLPGKVTSFLWRVSKACLPTNHALVRKQVYISILCPWCHTETETDVHVLFSCDFAKTVWSMAGMMSLIQYSEQESSGTMIKKMLEKCSRDQCVHLGMVCWSLWNRRNK